MTSTDAAVQSMLDEAAERADLDDFGDDWFLSPLTAWAEDLAGDHLTDFGREFLRRQAVRELVRRLRILDCLRRHPEIDDVPIPPIAYIIGPARSGTTLLHNLLGLHRSARALLRWELVEPLPPPETATFATDERIARVRERAEPLRGTLLEQMHWVDAEDPEECAWGLFDAVGILGQGIAACMPSWDEFLRTQDLTPALRNYRRLVQLLTWKHPVPPGGFLVLKAPQFLNRIHEVAAAFPEARFVVTHRDPFRTFTSAMTILAEICRPFLVDPGSGRAQLDQQLSILDSSLLGLVALDDVVSAPTTHVRYGDLMDEPSRVARDAIAASGLGDDEALGDAISRFLDAQAAGRRPRPPTEIDPMGLDHEDVWRRPAVASYVERFGIVREQRRLTGAAPTPA